jgi:hypothetical protein
MTVVVIGINPTCYYLLLMFTRAISVNPQKFADWLQLVEIL